MKLRGAVRLRTSLFIVLAITVLSSLWHLGTPPLAWGTPVYRYSFDDFPRNVARGSNNRGDIVDPAAFGAAGIVQIFDPERQTTFGIDGAKLIATDINDRGEIIGRFGANDDTYAPFILQGPRSFLYRDGTFTLLFGGAIAHAFANNDSGAIVGLLGGEDYFLGFVARDGVEALSFTAPGCGFSLDERTEAYGINNRGDIVGRFACGEQLGGFLLTDGEFVTSIQPPGFQTWSLEGINDRGQILGTYFDPNDPTLDLRYFLATPVRQPLSVVLLAVGLVTLLLKVRSFAR
jgi:hypothetical protein